jgi:aminoglycoside phosphotransferase (APT) family kinase protein/putative sterol carrier protein
MPYERTGLSEETQSKLLRWLQRKMPQAQNLSISGMKLPEGGFGAQNFLFDLTWQETGQSRTLGMALKCLPQDPIFPDFDLGRQFRVMERLQGSGISVPKTYWIEEDEHIIGTPFFLVGRVEGDIPPDFPLYHTFGCYYDAPVDQRARMYWECVETLAKVHTLDWRDLDFSFLDPPESGVEWLDRLLDYYDSYLSWVKDDPQEPQPVLKVALDWLKDNRYVPEHLSLCWGDCRLPNTIFSPEGEIQAVLDWDIASIADPESDVAWFLFFDWHHSEGYGVPRLEGTPGREEILRCYEELSGRKVKNLFYNEVLAAFRFGVIMLRITKILKKTGISLAYEDAEVNNAMTHRLADLLGLPAPGPKREVRVADQEEITLQLHLTGPGGSDWHVVCQGGKGELRQGAASEPAIVLTVSIDDWTAIQRGELRRTEAWLNGKLKIDGDLILLGQLEDTLSNITIPL